jgi:hypothetical protein
LIPVWLAPAKDPVNEYELGFEAITQVADPHKSPELETEAPDAGKDPPNTLNDWPATGVTPAPVT